MAGSENEDDLRLLEAAGAEAGALALSFFRTAQRTWTKDGGSPVGEADLAVDARLAEILRPARPDYGWLSEETADDPDRLSRRRLFVVDPIDGTRGFIEGNTRWGVSLAVVEGDRPVAGVLVAPARGESFSALAGEGAWRNGVRLRLGPPRPLGAARFASARRYARAVIAAAEAAGASPDVQFIPSLAYRIALVATGEIDVAIAKSGPWDWDLAAADLLVHEAGASLTDLEGGRIRYNRPVPRHPSLIAAAAAHRGAVAEAVKAADAGGT